MYLLTVSTNHAHLAAAANYFESPRGVNIHV